MPVLVVPGTTEATVVEAVCRLVGLVRDALIRMCACVLKKNLPNAL